MEGLVIARVWTSSAAVGRLVKGENTMTDSNRRFSSACKPPPAARVVRRPPVS